MRAKKILLIFASSLLALEAISHLYEKLFLQADSYDLRHSMNLKFEENIWRYKPNIKILAREKTGNILYQTNHRGFRAVAKESADRSIHPKALFIGDSVAFGLCSNQSIPQLLQSKKDNKYDFSSIALPGYNPKDYYYNYQLIKDKAKFRAVFVMTYMNDLTDPSIVDQAKGNVSKEKKN